MFYHYVRVCCTKSLGKVKSVNSVVCWLEGFSHKNCLHLDDKGEKLNYIKS